MRSLVSGFLLLAVVLAQAAARGAERPANLLVFLADDAGWGDYSLHGNRGVRTPNLDALARSGAQFEQFFVCALCAPTRAEFLTGRYHSRGGVLGVSEGQERLNLDENTFAQSLGSAGYRNGIFGKWHNGSQWPYHPLARGFHEFVGYTSGHWGEYFDAPLEENGRMIRSKGFIVDVLVDRAVGFIEQNRQRPFFCYVPLTTPHSPFSVPENYWQRHAKAAVEQRGSDGQAEDLNLTRCVWAMMEHLDDCVGRVLKRLRDLGLERDTVVVWFSDNGPNSGRWNGGLKGRKGQLDEGGLKSPLWVSWPSHIKAGTRIKSLSAAIDLRPSLLGLLGVKDKPVKSLDGRDWSASLLGAASESAAPRELFQYNGGRLSLRTETHRLDAAGNLYDLRSDPLQLAEVNEAQSKLRGELAHRASLWHREVFGSDYLPQPAAPKPGKAKAPRGSEGRALRSAPRFQDKRPYPVGFREFPLTMLEARDGQPHGSVRRSSAAPNCSYFVNWGGAKEDAISWEIEVMETGRYEVVLDQACAPGNEGCTIELQCGDSRLSEVVSVSWWPPLKQGEDRVPRKGESLMREFKAFRLGTVSLSAGRQTLWLRARGLRGPEAVQLRRLNLLLLP